MNATEYPPETDAPPHGGRERYHDLVKLLGNWTATLLITHLNPREWQSIGDLGPKINADRKAIHAALARMERLGLVEIQPRSGVKEFALTMDGYSIQWVAKQIVHTAWRGAARG